MVVPRWAGIASVKWLESIELVNTPFRGYYNAQRYIFVNDKGETTGIVREMPVKSVMAWPGEGETVALAPLKVFGFAWSGLGPIERVDVSVDDQQTWTPARLTHGEGPNAWTRWDFDWTPAARGQGRLSVRATDAAGNAQPASAPWNKFGYQMNAILTRTVTVQ
jgi:DMSO/TMAO reductase YedYZ molybdopterin-dependent catalytic subunit